MQMNKAILRNSEIVIFDKKNIFAAAPVSFFFPNRWIGNRFFFHVGLLVYFYQNAEFYNYQYLSLDLKLKRQV